MSRIRRYLCYLEVLSVQVDFPNKHMLVDDINPIYLYIYIYIWHPNKFMHVLTEVFETRNNIIDYEGHELSTTPKLHEVQ